MNKADHIQIYHKQNFTYIYHFMRNITRTLTATLLLLTVTTLSAQKRIVSCTTQPQYHNQAKEVYEFDSVDVQPCFPGGNLELFKFINDTRRYPAEAYNQRVQGRVLCGFIVNDDGSISNISLVKGVEESLNNEALRIISEMPRWEAGEVNNRKVPVYCILPIAFRL